MSMKLNWRAMNSHGQRRAVKVVEGKEPHRKPLALEEAPYGRWREGKATMDEDNDASRQSKRGSVPKSTESRAGGRDVPEFARLGNAAGTMARTGVANSKRAREGIPGNVV
jgi:hypothetical protein